MSQTKATILITGGSGYIGSLLTPFLLNSNYKVIVLDNLFYNQTTLMDCFADTNFSFYKGSISNIELLKKLISKSDIIIPLAAIVGAPASKKYFELSKNFNLEAPTAMIKLISKNQKVIFPTTNSGYGIGDKDSYCDETSKLRPISDYGKHKVIIEDMLLQTGNAITLRLATVFGMSPRMRSDLLVNNFVFNALKDGYLILFEEHFRRNYIHVRDVVNTFKYSIDNYDRMKNQPFNVGLSDANLTKRQLAEKIKSFLPETYIHSAKVGEDLDKRDYYVSNKKIESLGWKAKFSLDFGIKELINGYQVMNFNKYSNLS